MVSVAYDYRKEQKTVRLGEFHTFNLHLIHNIKSNFLFHLHVFYLIYRPFVYQIIC